ncbi:hypothetical protein DL89DRAFT_271263 [Linderina pennispora]|uniref:Uncharacterized protein n=1 Tax=Linderina pennispora TaxID=61395 RepID=A0A1Y1VV77_9FUNG|nr:uncharacterized protein DL89DRAFT_271263 [Linderina pennispora]ORX65180.1 hypothetical protein DL89DRAFT_271263 [Linderina pennispora]
MSSRINLVTIINLYDNGLLFEKTNNINFLKLQKIFLDIEGINYYRLLESLEECY